MVATTTQPTQITLCFIRGEENFFIPYCQIISPFFHSRRGFHFPSDKYYNVSYTVCFFNKKIRCLISEHKILGKDQFIVSLY
ncbi:unnamed protein product [Rhizophagus irregularis]|nr:unnamed protein product [Rhizophagus irregularis]